MNLSPLRCIPQPAPRSGVCRYCGCTYDRACEGGCWWIDAQQTVCSADPCMERYIAEFAGNLRRAYTLKALQGKDVFA